MHNRCFAVATLLFLFGGARIAGAQVASDVPQTHWAYAAVQDLASHGLILGYPSNGNFFGGRTVTRYEMATIVQRVLATVDQRITANNAANPGVTPDQLAEVRRLTDEYKVELTVIGTNMDKVQADLAGVKSDVDDLKSGLQSTIDNVQEHEDRLNTLDKTKVGSGVASAKIGILLQGWFQAGKGTDAATNAATGGSDSSFRIRRAEIHVDGTITKASYFHVFIDPAKQSSLNTITSNNNVQSASVNQANNILQDAFLGYQATPQVALEIGQQKVPMSYEGLLGSSALPTAERSLIGSTLPINRGGIGNLRDIGFLVRYVNGGLNFAGGAFDDGGNRQNTLDDNKSKEFIYHVQYTGIGHNGTLGEYQEISQGVNGLYGTQRQRLGGEYEYNSGPHLVMAEYAQGRDGALNAAGTAVQYPDIKFRFADALYGYSFTKKIQAVVRGEYLEPDKNRTLDKTFSRERDLTLGVNYYLQGNNAKVQVNYVRKDITGTKSTSGSTIGELKSASYLGQSRDLFIIAVQESF